MGRGRSGENNRFVDYEFMRKEGLRLELLQISEIHRDVKYDGLEPGSLILSSS